MKTTTKTKTKRPSTATSASRLTSDLCPLTSAPNPLSAILHLPRSAPIRHSIRHHFGFWSLDFDGHRAVFDHEQGAYYVAYLLLNPPAEPIHGLALELKANAYYQQRPDEPCETLIVDPDTGKTNALLCDAAVVERHLCADDGEGLASLQRKIEELEAILSNDDASEPVKAEVQRELKELYAYQRKNLSVTLSAAQKAVRAVRQAIYHFHKTLASAVHADGEPHSVLRPFAHYLEQYLLIPTARYSKPSRVHSIARVAGCFTYEPPRGVKWTA